MKYDDFLIFENGSRPPSWFLNFQNFNGQHVGGGNEYAYPYQISLRSVEPLLWCDDFSILQDGVRRHLGFLKFDIFNGRTAQEVRIASPCQIWSKSVKLQPKFDDFSIIHTATDAILDFYFFKFQWSERSVGPNCVAVPNVVEIHETAAEIWRFFSMFQDGGRRHLGFWNLKRAELRCRAKFGGNLSNCDFSIFQYGSRRHLRFFKFQTFNGRTAKEGRTA